MTGATEVELAWSTALWAAYHINDCSLDIDIPAESIYPSCIWRDILLHEGEHDKHETAGEAQNDVHYATDFSELWLVKLRH